ncbi:MAG: thiamine pyrophosphate-dependent enzyme, partial [Thermoanaerobaculia bacterium]
SLFDKPYVENTWCPGCGNFPIITALKNACSSLGLKPEELIIVSGIGQAAKLPHFFRSHFFNGLHGRALPAALGIKLVNPEMKVVAVGGDGDMLAEGGNHFIHTIRKNPDITLLLHNNMVYGLTKGQASPTSQLGYKTPFQIDGVIENPLNPLSLAISQDCSFVACTLAQDIKFTEEIIRKAVLHKGFSLILILQPCVSFNKVNTYQWFKENSFHLPENWDSGNREEALKITLKQDKFPLGVIYKNENKNTLEELVSVYQKDKTPLSMRKFNPEKLWSFLKP